MGLGCFDNNYSVCIPYVFYNLNLYSIFRRTCCLWLNFGPIFTNARRQARNGRCYEERPSKCFGIALKMNSKTKFDIITYFYSILRIFFDPLYGRYDYVCEGPRWKWVFNYHFDGGKSLYVFVFGFRNNSWQIRWKQ